MKHRANFDFNIILLTFQGKQYDDEEAKYTMGRLSILYHNFRKDNSAQEHGSKSSPLRGISFKVRVQKGFLSIAQKRGSGAFEICKTY